LSTTTENNERVIVQGFQVIRFKERITELKLTFGFYDFAKLEVLEDEVIALEGYTLSMEERLKALEKINLTVGVDSSDHDLDFVKFTTSYIQSGSGVVNPYVIPSPLQECSEHLTNGLRELTITTKVSSMMLQNLKVSVKAIIEKMQMQQILGHMHKGEFLVPMPKEERVRGHTLHCAYIDDMIEIKHEPLIDFMDINPIIEP